MSATTCILYEFNSLYNYKLHSSRETFYLSSSLFFCVCVKFKEEFTLEIIEMCYGNEYKYRKEKELFDKITKKNVGRKKLEEGSPSNVKRRKACESICIYCMWAWKILPIRKSCREKKIVMIDADETCRCARNDIATYICINISHFYTVTFFVSFPFFYLKLFFLRGKITRQFYVLN